MKPLPKSWDGLTLDCCECSTKTAAKKDVPAVIFEHLITEHRYTQAEAQRAIDLWREDIPQDEDGNPLGECRDHGYYPMGESCGGCQAIDHEIEVWKEGRYR